MWLLIKIPNLVVKPRKINSVKYFITKQMIDRVFFVSGGFVFLVYAINTPTQFMKEGKKDRKQKQVVANHILLIIK